MTLYFPPHWKNHFRDILSTIPHIQKRIGVDNWHRVLGKLRSMVIALPVARGLLIHMKKFLHHINGKRLTITKGVCQDLADFFWLAQYLERLPTCLYKLVLLHPILDIYNEAYGYIFGKGSSPRTPHSNLDPPTAYQSCIDNTKTQGTSTHCLAGAMT